MRDTCCALLLLAIVTAVGCSSSSGGAGKVLGECASNADCDDGVFCNGVELCIEEECESGSSPCVNPAACDESVDQCNTFFVAWLILNSCSGGSPNGIQYGWEVKVDNDEVRASGFYELAQGLVRKYVEGPQPLNEVICSWVLPPTENLHQTRLGAKPRRPSQAR